MAIYLRPRTPSRRASGSIEDPELDPGPIGHPSHQAVEGVYFSDDLAFSQPANRGIAGHHAEIGYSLGDQSRPCAHSSGRSGGLATGMPSTKHNDVESFRVRIVFHVKQSLPDAKPPEDVPQEFLGFI